MPNTELIFNNLAYGRIKGDISATDTEIELFPGHIMSFLPGWVTAKEFYVTLTNAEKDIEIVKVTGVDGNVLTVSRGQDGTSAQAWYSGSVITQRVVAGNLESFIQKEAFRTIDYNPNGILTANYPGEKVYQNGSESCQKRWFMNTSGTNWRLIAGVPCDGENGTTDLGESFDGNGYLVTPTGINFANVDPVVHTFPWGIYGIAYNGSNLWVAIGSYSSGSVNYYSSDDGQTWTEVLAPFGSSVQHMSKLRYLNGKFLMSMRTSSTTYIYSTSDGQSWTEEYSAIGTAHDIYDFAYDSVSGIYVAIGSASGGGPLIFTSTDLSSWTQRTAGGGYSGSFAGLCFDGTYFVAVGSLEEIQTSTDGITWTSRNTGGTKTLSAVATNNTDLYLTIGEDDTALSTSDPTGTWSSVTINDSPSPSYDDYLDVAFGALSGGDFFCVLAQDAYRDNRCWASRDLSEWTENEFDEASGYWVIAYADSKIICGNSGSAGGDPKIEIGT